MLSCTLGPRVCLSLTWDYPLPPLVNNLTTKPLLSPPLQQWTTCTAINQYLPIVFTRERSQGRFDQSVLGIKLVMYAVTSAVCNRTIRMMWMQMASIFIELQNNICIIISLRFKCWLLNSHQNLCVILCLGLSSC